MCGVKHFVVAHLLSVEQMHEGSHAAVLPVPVRCKGNRREVNGIVVVSVQHKLVARGGGAIVVADDTVVLETVEEVSRSTVLIPSSPSLTPHMSPSA